MILNKMKTSKECISCRHHSKFIEEHPCRVCITNDNLSCGFDKWEPIETKKDPSLFKTYFYYWWEITKMIARIFIKERYLSKYPDLNKFKRQDQKLFRNKIKLERVKFNELKRELKELI